jgi:hypothetical protein
MHAIGTKARLIPEIHLTARGFCLSGNGRIASTTTETGLTVACQLDSNVYEKGIKMRLSGLRPLPAIKPP